MSTARPSCPYVGLRPYRKEDRDYFFGRDGDRRVIVSNLYASPLTVLYGASGVGKSSVLLAGVIPHLDESPHAAAVIFRRWSRADFLGELKRTVAERVPTERREALGVDPALPFDELVHRAARALRARVMVVFDQFEDYFTYHPEAETGATFDTELARAINREEVDASFLFSLREDALSRLDRFQVRIPNLLGNLLRLDHLDLRSAEEAIRRPLDVHNERVTGPGEQVTIEEKLVREILEEVTSGNVVMGAGSGIGLPRDLAAARIETPFLQLVLMRIWAEEQRAGSRALRLETLVRLGGAAVIVRTHLDQIMARLSPDQQRLCASIFDRMVTPSGVKIACRTEDLRSWAKDLAGQLPDVLTALSSSEDRILRAIRGPSSQPSATQYEIFHDVLAPAILAWQQRYLQDREREATEARLAAAAAERDRERAHQHELERAEEAAREQKQRAAAKARTARNLGIAIVVLAVALLGTFWMMARAKQDRDRAAAELAHAEEMLASARQDTDKMLAVARRDGEEAKSRVEEARMVLERYRKNLRARQALLARHVSDEEAERLGARPDSTIPFKVSYDARGARNYHFKYSPDPAWLKGRNVALITYRMVHESFRNPLNSGGPEDGFAVWYEGWGCLRRVTAVIEYEDPETPADFTVFDACALQQPAEQPLGKP